MIETRICKCEYCGAEFDKRAQYMFCKIIEYMFGGFLIVFTGILMIALIALIVWLIIDFIKNGA